MSAASYAGGLAGLAGSNGHGGPPTSTDVFGIEVQTAGPATLLRRITTYAKGPGKHRVVYVNAHVLNRSMEDDELRRSLLDADIVYCDGYGVRLAAWAADNPIPERMTGADWVWGLAPLCETTGTSLYLLGSEPEVAAQAARKLRRWFPRLRVVGHHHGYFDGDSEHNERVIEHIAEVKPDILMVGMGTPKQETWSHREFDRIEANVIWSVGSLFDYVAGRMPRAPRWLADNGMEWVFRLGLEPRRMWRRYLIGNPVFLGRVAGEAHRRRAASERDLADQGPPGSPIGQTPEAGLGDHGEQG